MRTMESPTRTPARTAPPAWRAPTAFVLGCGGVLLAAWSALLGARADAPAGDFIRAVLVAVWSFAGIAVALRRRDEPLGAVVSFGSFAAAAGTAAAALLSYQSAGHAVGEALHDGANLVRPLALALVPIAGMHVILGLPDGTLRESGRKAVVVGAYVLGAALALVLWTKRESLPLWPVAVESALAFGVAFPWSNARYQRLAGAQRQRMQWFGWAATVAVAVSGVSLATRVLAGWPDQIADVAAAGTVLIPIGLVLGATSRMVDRVDRLLAHTISLAGLAGVVVGVYVAIVLGLGRVPSRDERTLLLLSMAAAGVAAIVYLPTRNRLQRWANRLVYGERQAPDDVLRTFGTRLSRAVPLDELLMQVAESLRKTLGLGAAEVWTGSGGSLERSVSVPERSPTKITLTAQEEPVVARAGVSGPAWIKIWLPTLLAGREGTALRVAPVTHSGELLGLIVAERPSDADTFVAEDERVLSELARQVGLVLHNVRLDSALQASLDEVRRQAEELRASRARIVAAGDAVRRKILRDLHDGAQQHLVALAVKLNLAKKLAGQNAEKAQALIDELGGDIQTTIQEVRDLAHGIYPPLLMDRGIKEALSAAAGRASLPTAVEGEGLGRYPPEVEATVYFCCLEALQNAAKHAGESARVRIRVWEEAGGLLFEVADDGAGFVTGGRAPGAGFTNMGDRLGSIGGSLRVDSAPGRGTRVSAAIPLSVDAQRP